MPEGDTIVSLATLAGESALGIIRVSGSLCLKLCDNIFETPSPTPRKALLRNYKALTNKNIDQILLVYFDHGKSYTGEATLEISFHGNPLIADQILNDLISRKCRLAEPGEYTKRAFLNGKLDLTQAESVAELIAAKSEIELEIANHQLLGSLSNKLRNIQLDLIRLQAKFEASIDFPEDEITEHNLTEIQSAIASIKKTINQLIKSADLKESFSQGIKVSLIGPPNVGKSSIFNNLIHSNRAIVNSKPGTTRDYLSKEIVNSGYRIELFDTAGIRDTVMEVEKQGIENTVELIKDSSVILLVFDSSLPYPINFLNYIKNEINNQSVIIIENKNDLKRKIITDNYPPHFNIVRSSTFDDDCSSKIVNEIVNAIKDKFKVNPSSDILVSKRQNKHLNDSMLHLSEVQELCTIKIEEEIILQELKLCLESINLIIGQTDNEDMLDELFKNFCIGK